MNFEIIVVANKKRNPVIVPYLKKLKIKHKICWSDDPGLPDNWVLNQTYKGLCIHQFQHEGQWNCLEAHKRAIEMSKKDNVLILEDDAEPIIPNWLDIADEAVKLLDRFQIVSIHSREPNFLVWKKEQFLEGIDLFYPKDNITPRRALGTLAYFVNKDTLPIIQTHYYNGLPIDLFYCNCFNFCFISPSPFLHQRNQGSLIDIGTYK
jgi:hypothetical protein